MRLILSIFKKSTSEIQILRGKNNKLTPTKEKGRLLSGFSQLNYYGTDPENTKLQQSQGSGRTHNTIRLLNTSSNFGCIDFSAGYPKTLG